MNDVYGYALRSNLANAKLGLITKTKSLHSCDGSFKHLTSPTCTSI